MKREEFLLKNNFIEKTIYRYNGFKSEIFTYDLNGDLSGQSSFYYEDGSLFSRCFFNKNVLHGIDEIYNYKGLLYIINTWKVSFINGVVIIFN